MESFVFFLDKILWRNVINCLLLTVVVVVLQFLLFTLLSRISMIEASHRATPGVQRVGISWHFLPVVQADYWNICG